MRTQTKVLLLGLLGAGIAAYRHKRRQLASARSPSFDSRDASAAAQTPGTARDVVVVEAEIVGIADVDPENLTQMGEAIDPEMTQAAHEEIPEQRARLPRDKT